MLFGVVLQVVPECQGVLCSHYLTNCVLRTFLCQNSVGLDRSSLLPLRKITANQTTTLPDGTVVTFGNGRDVTLKGSNGETRNGQLQKELIHMLKKWEAVFRLFADDILLHPFSLSRILSKGWRQLHKLRGSIPSEIKDLFN